MTPEKKALFHAARDLDEWFSSVLRACDERIFSVSESRPHREAAVLAILSRNAKLVVEASLDPKGKLYTPVAMVLASASRRLDVTVTEGHWKAAFENVAHACAAPRGLGSKFGISIGTPAAVFKTVFDEALINAGVTDRPTILVEENRRTSLALAINWGLRFLLAYALEVQQRATATNEPKLDLWWIRERIEGLVAVPKPSRSGTQRRG